MATVPPPPELPPEAPPPVTPPDDAATSGQSAGEEQPGPSRPRRGRLLRLLASAAVLGVVAGVATGYTVQADRKPTPLSDLSQNTLAYPDKRVPADEVEPLTAEHDHRVRTDGDLRKLLIPRPKGTQDADLPAIHDNWMTAGDFASGFDGDGMMFRQLTHRGVRRIAARAWDGDKNRTVIVQLVQFRDLGGREAKAYTDERRLFLSQDVGYGTDGSLLEGTGNGRYWTADEPDRSFGAPVYEAEAIAWRGDIAMSVYVLSADPVPGKLVKDVAERQLEKL